MVNFFFDLFFLFHNNAAEFFFEIHNGFKFAHFTENTEGGNKETNNICYFKTLKTFRLELILKLSR